MPSRKLKPLGLIGALGVALVIPMACSEDEGADGPVSGSVVLVDRSLAALQSAQIDYLVGAYVGTTCAGRSGAWSIASSGAPSSAPTGLPRSLTVPAGAMGCQLTLTGVYVDVNGTSTLHEAATPISLADAMVDSAVSAFSPSGGAIAFYANASLSDAAATGNTPDSDFSGFASDFTIRVVVSDDLAAAGTGAVSAVSTTAATLSGSVVRAPNYELGSLASIAVWATGTTVSRAPEGNLAFSLTDVNAAGQSYRIVDSNLSAATYAVIDARFKDVNAVPGVVPNADPERDGFNVPAADLLQVNDELAGGRPVSVIITNINAQTQVPAYQVFTIRFDPPPVVPP